VLSLLWFVVGGLLGWWASRGGSHVQRAWPIVLRVQILLTAATLSLFAAWRLTALTQLVGPLVLAGGLWFLFGVAVATRGERSTGEGALESWAVGPNSGFWVVPVAAAFAGSAGAMIAVLANAANAAENAVCVHLMRRDAPVRQRRSTSWVDQSPVLALAAGLLLHLAGPAPASSKEVLALAGPLLAFSGAALFAGSVVHPHNLSVPKSDHARRRWTWLTMLRLLDPAGRRRRRVRPERAVLHPDPAGGPVRLPLRCGERGRPLGLGTGPIGSRSGRRYPLGMSCRAPSGLCSDWAGHRHRNLIWGS
jgi:predicted permease